MARMYPQWIPESEREANLDRRAEYLVYDCLAGQLGDDWLVLYSQAIKWAHRYGVSDREADFIVAHPNLGVVMIEVKGGGIEREGGIWYSIPLQQLKHQPSKRRRWEIKNPYQQATDAAKAYERKLDDYVRHQVAPRAMRLPKRRFKIATAVCFPDVEVPTDLPLAGDALPELTLSHRDLTDLKQRLYEILKLYQGETGDLPGEQGLELLKTVLARDWHIESYLAYEFETVEQRRKQLTEEQFQLLYALEYNPKMLIAGCAGSGKTVLAVEKARRLADQGQRVLLTCFNYQLAEWLKQRPYRRQDIEIAHFHDLCRQAAGAASEVELPEWSSELEVSQAAYYNRVMPDALELAALELELAFDAIIVDEGQDFEESWFRVLYGLLRDPDKGVFYVFYDDNQKVYGRRKKIPFPWPVFRLTKNLRNTNPIFNLILDYYHQPQHMQASGITGPEPVFIPLRDPTDEPEVVQQILAQLVAQQIPPSHIAILTPTARQGSCWSQASLRSGDIPLIWQVDPHPNQVTCSTIRTFKGLERPVIILTELHRLEPWQVAQLLYVAISRARNHLIVIGELPSPEAEAEEEAIF